MIILKVTKSQGFTLSLKNTLLEKSPGVSVCVCGGGSNETPLSPVFLGNISISKIKHKYSP